MKSKIFLFLLSIVSFQSLSAQNEEYQEIEFKKIAEGVDSPIPDLQIVCFNKFFNKDYLPEKFSEKYGLTDRSLFKKKMLVEIFQSDQEGTGIDKIEIVKILEGKENIQIEYRLINENPNKDDQKLAPFIIVQIPKSKKKIQFIKDGSDLGQVQKAYVD
ncbi:hypothetical protein GCM10023115_41530 [Pontixanthobacter gangjinensis]|uniref:Uncharacterized protein n=1 Tax=Christiangramia aestuarii TaxID=1028746 RepID=A0A7K1LSJ2_9FLAO|nr:hypothetical protein [Christiangramia aestuarii]MUP43460.1 hypothetical protein [Christiangramia aestuarii]